MPTSTCLAPVSTWSPARLAAQLLLVSGQFGDLAASTPLAQAGVGGLVLFGQPAPGAGPAIAAGIAALRSAAAAAGAVVPWFATDEEGGGVQRLAQVAGALPSARQMAATWTETQTADALAAYGRALAALGLTMDLAPVLDVASPADLVSDEAERSFSDDPAVVARYGVADARGLAASSVVPVVKHFPGLGRASADTDLGPATDPPLSELRAGDLVPFRAAIEAGVPVVMVGNPVVPELTGGMPASLSAAAYQLLRQLGFAGVAITDSLGAGAISATGESEAQAGLSALESGADMAMIDAQAWPSALATVEGALASGQLSAMTAQRAVLRIVAAKGLAVCLS